MQFLSEYAFRLRQIAEVWIGFDARSEPDQPTVTAPAAMTDSGGGLVLKAEIPWDGGEAAQDFSKPCGLLKWASKKVGHLNDINYLLWTRLCE